ncbi:hypothetical protein [Synechococcus sp. PCC 7336]|uniref:hypothetical protein n=1 Tax=Synechococcus sp. PCC 7336 TaxID=195250 RepID=UPI0003485E76|nr:hypothetical protein [Synechococcus sp. PCC 7336]
MTPLLEACVPVQSPTYVPSHLTRPYLDMVRPSSWIKLLDLPSEYSYHEALLLCQLSEDEWVAWIPDYGEAVLHIGEFCPMNWH